MVSGVSSIGSGGHERGDQVVHLLGLGDVVVEGGVVEHGSPFVVSWRAGGQATFAGATVTGMALSTALPDSGSMTASSVRMLVLTPA